MAKKNVLLHQALRSASIKNTDSSHDNMDANSALDVNWDNIWKCTQHGLPSPMDPVSHITHVVMKASVKLLCEWHTDSLTQGNLWPSLTGARWFQVIQPFSVLLRDFHICARCQWLGLSYSLKIKIQLIKKKSFNSLHEGLYFPPAHYTYLWLWE